LVGNRDKEIDRGEKGGHCEQLACKIVLYGPIEGGKKRLPDGGGRGKWSDVIQAEKERFSDEKRESRTQKDLSMRKSRGVDSVEKVHKRGGWEKTERGRGQQKENDVQIIHFVPGLADRMPLKVGAHLLGSFWEKAIEGGRTEDVEGTGGGNGFQPEEAIGEGATILRRDLGGVERGERKRVKKIGRNKY